MKKKERKKFLKKSKKPKSKPSVIFRRDHLRFISGIICGSGSFSVQFGDHMRSGDHLRSGIICGAVQIAEDRTMFYLLRSPAITIAGSQAIAEVCFHMIAELSTICDPRSSAIIWKPALKCANLSGIRLPLTTISKDNFSEIHISRPSP